MTDIKPIKLLPWRRWDVMAATAALNLCTLALSLLMIQFCDQTAFDLPENIALLIGSGLLGILCFDLLIRYARDRVLNWLQLRYACSTMTSIFDQMLSLEPQMDPCPSFGKQMEALDNGRDIKEFFNSHEFMAILNIPFIPVFLGIICFLSPVVTVVPAIGCIVFGIIAIYQGHKLNKLLDSRHFLDNQHSSFIAQILQNYQTLKALGMENLLLRQYEKLYYQKSFFENKITRISGQTRDLILFISYALLLGIVCITSFEVLAGHLSIGAMSACIILTSIAIHPLQTILKAWPRIKHIQQINKKISQQHHKVKAKTPSNATIQELTGRFRLENIEFKYPDMEKPILAHLNLSVEPHTIVTIFGANGVGKTTLAKLITNRLAPQQGKITFDGYEAQAFLPNAFARQVMYVPPTTQLFAGTIIDNLTLFRVGPLIEEAMKLSRDLGLETWIENYPQSYQAYLNDKMLLNIPDGMKQRIGLIRALLNEPRILILDESNAAIDDDGEAQLKKVLQDLKEVSTIILITHRPSMKQIADESYDLVNGNLVPSMNVNHGLKVYQPTSGKALEAIP